jgi:hypothetical protein
MSVEHREKMAMVFADPAFMRIKADTEKYVRPYCSVCGNKCSFWRGTDDYHFECEHTHGVRQGVRQSDWWTMGHLHPSRRLCDMHMADKYDYLRNGKITSLRHCEFGVY